MSDEKLLGRRRLDLDRIRSALDAAGVLVRELTSGRVEVEHKENLDPVTIVDLEVNKLLEQMLPQEGEGWLSEETADDRSRLGKHRVWVVDPLDGTKEFVQGLPEWCVSIGLVEEGRAVAGGILNPASGELIIGSRETGVLYNGEPARVRELTTLEGAEMLASRSVIKRGQWDRFKDGPIRTRPMGSVAYKLALVAAGRTDATWSLAPKHEWDVAAGVALVEAGGGVALTIEWKPPSFNQAKPWLPGLVAMCPALVEPSRALLEIEGDG